MAISKEEEEQRSTTRAALLTAIEKQAELASRKTDSNVVFAENLHHLAEAYALVVGTEKAPGKMRSV